jgi:hypothetical protein
MLFCMSIIWNWRKACSQTKLPNRMASFCNGQPSGIGSFHLAALLKDAYGVKSEKAKDQASP